MGMFIAAYLVVWLAVLGYAARLDLRQRHLQERLDALDARLADRPAGEGTASKAA